MLKTAVEELGATAESIRTNSLLCTLRNASCDVSSRVCIQDALWSASLKPWRQTARLSSTRKSGMGARVGQVCAICRLALLFFGYPIPRSPAHPMGRTRAKGCMRAVSLEARHFDRGVVVVGFKAAENSEKIAFTIVFPASYRAGRRRAARRIRGTPSGSGWPDSRRGLAWF